MDKQKILDSLKDFKKIDRAGMYEVAISFPEMMLGGYGLPLKGSLRSAKKLKKIVVSGMGGSAIAGDVVAGLFISKLGLPVFVARDYQLPAFVDSETLVIALSYSGDTEETLSAALEAIGKKAMVVCVTSGGKLLALAEKNKLPHFLIPGHYQPRAALPYLLLPILKVLAKLGLYPDLEKDFNEALAVLRQQQKELGFDVLAKDNQAKQLAKAIAGKLPIILAASGITEAAAKRLKSQLSENSKQTSLVSIFPEMCHNEIVNLAALKRSKHSFCALLLRDEESPPRLKKRIEITKSLVGGELGGIQDVCTQGKSDLARILSLIYLGDMLSVYLAALLGRDPSEIEVITKLKRELSR